jgi:hypothetical protein
LAIVADVGAGSGGRDGGERRTLLLRTVKSCGPDAPVLASSRVEAKAFADDGGKKAGHQGEREISRKAIAWGRPERFR